MARYLADRDPLPRVLSSDQSHMNVQYPVYSNEHWDFDLIGNPGVLQWFLRSLLIGVHLYNRDINADWYISEIQS